jgi:hypothetical protein
MLSSTYRLSTRFDASNDAVDSGNRLLWRMNRVRLDVEALRDGLLAVSGQLEQRIGGPSIADLLVSRRRSIYGAVHRDNKTESDEFLRMFDFPNPRMSSSGRTLTTVPQQQLFALNSGFMSRQAKALAARVLREHADTDARIQRTFALVVGRTASPAELRLGRVFLSSPQETKEPAGFSLWEQFCQVLLCSNEFLFRP